MRPRFALASLALIFAAVLATVAPREACAQSFGKNKVHYEQLTWAVLETPHLRVHYYAQEESLARALTAFAESVAVEFDGRFAMKPRHKVPLLLYSTHHLFQQTNATPELMSESVGGLTELIKGRVLLPHNGSWSRLRWVARHELTHAYMIEKFSQVMHAHKKPPQWFPPLWFIEGLAEYCGTTWDADAEGLLRDMVVSGMAYPMTRSEPITGSVEMYKEGQAFLLWLAERYGDDKIFALLENAWRAEDFETCFRIVYGRPLVDVDLEWFAWLRRQYLPTVARLTRAREVGQPIPQRSRFNLGPRALPNASPTDTTVRLCFFEVNDGAVDLVVSEPDSGRRRERRMLRSGGSPAFESFHLFQNRPGVSPSGRVVISSQHGGRDALYVIDSRRGEVIERLEFPELVAIHDPVLAPGDSAVIFAAQDYDGQSDLYMARVGASGPGAGAGAGSDRRGRPELRRLTHDDFDDLDPAVSPDGRWVAFASDRCDLAGRTALYRLSLEDGHREQLTQPPVGDDRQPVWSPDGRWLAFRSTRAGTSDLYVRAAAPGGGVRRVTRMLGPVSDPDWTWDGGGLLATVQEGVTFRTWLMRFSPDTLAEVPERMPGREPALATVLPGVVHAEPAQRYQRRVGLDLLQNSIGTSPSFNSTLGFGQVAFSDVLGNEQFVFTLANDSESFGDFWDGWEGGLTYLNQAQRLNYALGVFRLTSLYDPDFELLRREKRLGLLAVASYPFSRFDRIEAGVEVKHASNHLLRNGSAPTVDLVSNYLSIVHDNSRWTWDGPVGGSRLNLSAGATRDMSGGRADFGTVFGEFRHYRHPFRPLTLTMRTAGSANFGRDAQRIYLGGPTRLRVTERRYLSGLSAVTSQVEARFPLVRNVVIAVPSPWQFPTVHGTVFGDGAWVWENGERREVGVAGWGLYLGGGFYPAFRWNWMWTTDDFRKFDSGRPSHAFLIAYNF
ncbi:MAG: PD40 domain-containing protein [Candidatus Eisenbacteria bacterium]|nr:PD40 domain-containing protein [Candidatus Eisenbacteria bacterium]